MQLRRALIALLAVAIILLTHAAISAHELRMHLEADTPPALVVSTIRPAPLSQD